MGLLRMQQQAVGLHPASHFQQGRLGLLLDDEAALRGIVASDLFLQCVKLDEANFTATEVTLTLAVQERRVVWS